MKRLHVIVSGRVQRVGFRWETKLAADALFLNGWVRNLPDGRVEAVFEGPDGTLDAMLAWCRKGPPYAKVADVIVNWETGESALTGFQIRY